jgi:dihydrolipoamide dehydrogenase
LSVADQTHYDLIVIGSGPAGYVGAIRAAQLGKKVACVERSRLGGVCLNWGCIPSKALLHNAELYFELSRHGREWGIETERLRINWDTIIQRSRGVADQLNKGIVFLFKKNKIEHHEGHAKVVTGRSSSTPCTVEIRTPDEDYYHGTGKAVKKTITADNVLIATGAAPRELPGAAADGKTIINSYHALQISKQPKKLLVVGSGAIGMEFAYFFNAFGSEVTVVEMLDRVLPIEDEDISKAAQKAFEKQGMSFHLGHTVKSIDVRPKGGAKATIVNVQDEKKTLQVECDVVLVAIGVTARMDGLVDDSLGLKLVKGHVQTDYMTAREPTYQTSIPGVYAVGDVIGPPWLAHKGSEEAVVCVERMFGHHAISIDYTAIPGCTYCNPQIASIGLTERAVKEKGIEYKVGKYPLKAHGKAIAVGATEGLVKIITSKKYGEILGAHIMGEDASELIAELGLAKRLEATAEDIISTVHAHPTMNEAIHEAALAGEGRMIHG